MMLAKQILRKISVGVIVLCVGIALFFMGSSVMAQDKEPVAIGVALAQTGPLATEAGYEIKGIQTAIEEINELGGVHGRPFKAIFEDTESRPKAAMDAVRKLVEINKVPLIIGCHPSSNTIPTAKYTSEKKVIQISTSSTSPTVRTLGPSSFSIVGLDDLLGKYQVRFALAVSGGIKRWGIMVINDAYGVGLGNVMKAEIEKEGGEVVSYIKYEPNKTDYRAELQRLFAEKPEGVLSIAWGEMAKIQFKQAYEMGLLEPVKGRWYFPYPTNLNQCLPETVEDVKGLDVFYGSSRTSHFAERFKKLFPDTPITAYAARGYDACWVAALAIGIAGEQDKEKLRQAISFAFGAYKGASSEDLSVDEDGMQKTQIFASYVMHNGTLERFDEKLWGTP